MGSSLKRFVGSGIRGLWVRGSWVCGFGFRVEGSTLRLLINLRVLVHPPLQGH